MSGVLNFFLYLIALLLLVVSLFMLIPRIIWGKFYPMFKKPKKENGQLVEKDNNQSVKKDKEQLVIRKIDGSQIGGGKNLSFFPNSWQCVIIDRTERDRTDLLSFKSEEFVNKKGPNLFWFRRKKIKVYEIMQFLKNGKRKNLRH